MSTLKVSFRNARTMYGVKYFLNQVNDLTSKIVRTCVYGKRVHISWLQTEQDQWIRTSQMPMEYRVNYLKQYLGSGGYFFISGTLSCTITCKYKKFWFAKMVVRVCSHWAIKSVSNFATKWVHLWSYSHCTAANIKGINRRPKLTRSVWMDPKVRLNAFLDLKVLV